ncbi:MAG: hypothetical protein Q9163_002012 [Psora crenata]
MTELLAEKVMQPAIKSEQLAYCPTMDLIALATLDERIHVYRLNGQGVFGYIEPRDEGKVRCIRWRPNGRSLVVAYDDMTLSLVDSHSGKIVRRVNCAGYSDSQICCLGWGVSNKACSNHTQDMKHQSYPNDDINQNADVRFPNMPLDLPKSLVFLEVESVLPKLSPLASGSVEDDLFSSQISVDALFRPMAMDATDSADILLVGFEDGTIHLSIYDFFEIGTFKLGEFPGTALGRKPLLHCFHPLSTTHTLVLSHSSHDDTDLSLVPLDLRLLSNVGPYLSILASKSTELHNLLLYIRQVQVQMYSDFRASQDLPRRFISIIEETLNEEGGWSWAGFAYHLVVTGNCPSKVKKWLVDQIGERGHKRWEKAVSAGYESIRRLAQEHLLPALGRVVVLVSRLRGLSSFEISNRHLGLITEQLDRVIDTVSCLQLVAHQLLIISGSELRQFQAFSVWLRQEIDIQASDATSLEPPESGTAIDHSSTLDYIRGPMAESALAPFFGLKGDADQWDLVADDGSLFELYQNELKENVAPSQRSKQPPRLDALINHLDKQCSNVFQGIAETQRRNVSIGPPVSLGKGNPKLIDMRMLAEAELGPGSWKVRDIKFADDNDLMLAMSIESESRLFLVPYRPEDVSRKGLKYKVDSTCISDQSGITTGLSVSDSFPLDEYTWLKFRSGVSWTPKFVDVNGRKGRRAACVLAEDQFHYRVYDLDNRDPVAQN